jgi:hypothetical protein
VLILTYNRLFYGVDFGDEAIYAAAPYRFVLGDKRFVDDTTLFQITSLISFPVVKFYYEITHGTDGIILFLRQAYFILSLLISCLVYFSLKDSFDKRIALLVSLTCVVYAYANLFTFSYNTQASLFFTAGCFLGAWAISDISRAQNYIFLLVAGLLHGLTTISYPPMGLSSLVFIIILLFWIEKDKFKQAFFYLIGFSIPLLFLLSLEGVFDYILARFQTITETRFSYQAGTNIGNFDKLISLFTYTWIYYPYKSFIFVFTVGMVIYHKFYQNRYPWIILFLIFIVAIPFIHVVWVLNYFSSSYYLIYYSLFAPYLLIFLDPKHNTIRKLFWIIWLPALIAGLTTGWASRNGWPNIAVGILPGALITTLLLVTVISDSMQKMLAVNSGVQTLVWYKFQTKVWTPSQENLPPEKISHSSRAHYFLALIPASVLALMLFYYYGAIYGDGMGRMTDLTEKVEIGPYQGLYTTSERKEFISVLSQNLRRFIRQNDQRILFYDFFAAGYLFTSLHPASTTVWEISLGTYPNVNRDSIMGYYQNKNNWPDIVVKMKTGFDSNGWTGHLNDVRDDPLNRFIKQSYKLVFKGKDYSIFRTKFK